MGQCAQVEWIVGGGGLYGYFREQRLPFGVQNCPEGFHRRCVDYLSRYFIQKWDSPNAESVLATVGKASLLVELIDVVVVETWRLGPLEKGFPSKR